MKYIFMISLITLFFNGCATTSKNVETPLKVENEVSSKKIFFSVSPLYGQSVFLFLFEFVFANNLISLQM